MCYVYLRFMNFCISLLFLNLSYKRNVRDNFCEDDWFQLCFFLDKFLSGRKISRSTFCFSHVTETSELNSLFTFSLAKSFPKKLKLIVVIPPRSFLQYLQNRYLNVFKTADCVIDIKNAFIYIANILKIDRVTTVQKCMCGDFFNIQFIKCLIRPSSTEKFPRLIKFHWFHLDFHEASFYDMKTSHSYQYLAESSEYFDLHTVFNFCAF